MRVSATVVMKLVSPHPARQGVEMKVAGNAGAGCFADIEAEVKAVGVVEAAEDGSVCWARSMISWAASTGSWASRSRWAKGMIIT